MMTVSKAVLLAATMLHAVQAEIYLDLPAGSSAGFGAPSSGLTQTLMYHDSLAWVDLTGAKFKQVPVEIQGIPSAVPSAKILAGSKVRFDCPVQETDGCQAYVWFYFCPGKNCNPVYQGGVPSTLAVTPNWVFTLCAPLFVTGVPSGYIHQMRGYRHRLAPGQEVAVDIPNQTEFFAFGLEKAPEDCSQYAAQIPCESATSNQRCVWNAIEGKCVETTCKRGGQGPPPPCLECPWEGLEVRDPADGP